MFIRLVCQLSIQLHEVFHLIVTIFIFSYVAVVMTNRFRRDPGSNRHHHRSLMTGLHIYFWFLTSGLFSAFYKAIALNYFSFFLIFRIRWDIFTYGNISNSKINNKNSNKNDNNNYVIDNNKTTVKSRV